MRVATATIAPVKLAKKGADIDGRCGAGCDEKSAERINSQNGAHRGDPGSLHAGHLHPLGGRPGQGAGHERRLQEPVMLEQNDEWSLNRRYMQFEGLQTLCDTVPTPLPAATR